MYKETSTPSMQSARGYALVEGLGRSWTMDGLWFRTQQEDQIGF